MATSTYDETRAEAFAERMLDMLNGGALMVMASVGHRTGLFDALAETDAATSSGARGRGRVSMSATFASGSVR